MDMSCIHIDYTNMAVLYEAQRKKALGERTE